MIAANYSELRAALKDYLDAVENDQETVVIKRKTGKGSILMSLEEYNSIMETLHLLGSKNMAIKLYDSIEQFKEGKIVQKDGSDLR